MSNDSNENVAVQSDVASALSTVLALLLQDRRLSQVDVDTLPWDRPIFVLRSAYMERLRSLLRIVLARTPVPPLHIMSHARDEGAIRAMANGALTYYPYPTPGPYRLEEMPSEMLDRLQSVGFGALVFLDAGNAGEGLDDVQRLLAAIGATQMVAYRADGTFAQAQDWRRHRLATAAFYRLIEWYHAKLDPGFPDGPVVPGDVLATVRR